jgi:hypothetical protein
MNQSIRTNLRSACRLAHQNCLTDKSSERSLLLVVRPRQLKWKITGTGPSNEARAGFGATRWFCLRRRKVLVGLYNATRFHGRFLSDSLTLSLRFTLLRPPQILLHLSLHNPTDQTIRDALV